MKKHLTLAKTLGLALVIGLVFAGCGGNRPSRVARQFFAAVEKGEVSEFHKYATPDTASAMGMFGEKAKGAITAKGGIVSTKETINDKTAVVTVKFKDGSEEKVDLVLVDGKWKVTMKFENGK
jgi:hypothetical protein